jgi:hypothetical protein
VLHPPEQVVGSAHWLVAHAPLEVFVQAPDPLQTDAVVANPFEQLAGVQITVLSGKPQALPSLPSHCPLQGAVPPQTGRVPRGAPDCTIVHRPTLFASLHDSH